MQQYAVNRCTNLGSGEVYSVNGPPGTGKTTLLKDVIADICVKRAKVLCTLNSPLEAFEKTRINNPSDATYVYPLIPKMKGFEVLVASSNNGAVENISKDLFLFDSIHPNYHNYFNLLPEVLRNFEAHEKKPVPKWGLFSLAMGKFSNIVMNLNKIEYYPKSLEKLSDEEKQTYLRKHMTLKDWCKQKDEPEPFERCKQEFLELLEQLDKEIEKQSFVFNVSLEYSRESKKIGKLRSELSAIKGELAEKVKALESAEAEYVEINCAIEAMNPPGFMERLFFRKNSEKKLDAISSWEGERLKCYQQRKLLKSSIQTLRSKLEKIEKRVANFNKLQKKYDNFKIKNSGDVAYFDQGFDSKGFQSLTPMHSRQIKDLRARVFALSIKLHNAWLHGSRKRLVALSVNLRKSLLDYEYRNTPVGREVFKQAFLLFPVMSSTFASLGRFLGDLDGLGWLLIDEAGQALPQQSVGAMLRFDRSVVVGDPLQLEPIRTIPQKIHNEIYQHFSKMTDLRNYNCFFQSVQSVADLSHKHCCFIGEKRLGTPLRVHRRCSEPMFSISNQVAYDSKMIFGKHEDPKLRELNPRSKWLSVSGPASGRRLHWVEKQGELTRELVFEICERDFSNKKSLYIITPFKECEYFLKRSFSQSWIKKAIGTIHTFQGKEADVVIMVLGLDERKKGAALTIVNDKPNLLNVAVTRAKNSLIIIGDEKVWGDVYSFDVARNNLEVNQDKPSSEQTWLLNAVSASSDPSWPTSQGPY